MITASHSILGRWTTAAEAEDAAKWARSEWTGVRVRAEGAFYSVAVRRKR